MKLHELLENAAAYAPILNNVQSSERRTSLGSGRESMAYFKPTQPNVAYRVSQRDQATTVLLQSLATSRHSNPFLPNVRATKGVNGGVQVTSTERLQPLSIIQTAAEFQQIVTQVIGTDIDKFSLDPKVKPIVALRDGKLWLAEMVFWYLEHGEYPSTRYTYVNPHLAEARNILQRVIADAALQGINAQVDHAHVDNLMLRPTGTGYQLVVNDPLTSQR